MNVNIKTINGTVKSFDTFKDLKEVLILDGKACLLQPISIQILIFQT